MITKVAHGIKVISSNPHKLLAKNGIATIQNSVLDADKEFTICLRFKNYQFDNSFNYLHSVLSVGGSIKTN